MGQPTTYGMDEKNKQVIDLLKQGKSLRDVAQEVGISKSTVQRIKKSWLNPRWTEVGSDTHGPVDLYGAVEAPDAATLLKLNEDTVFACVDWCAKAVAKSDLKTLVTTYPGQKSPRCLSIPTVVKSQRLQRIAKAAEVKQVLDHPLVELLDHPCPELSKYDWLYYIDSQLSLTANAYVHIVRENYERNKYGQPTVNEGLPVALYPLMTAYVKQQAEDGHVVGYSYSLTNEEILYPKQDIIHFRMISHENPYAEGYGPVRAVYERILLAKNELAYLNSLFRNQARPDSIIMLKGGASPDQCERVQKEMAMRFRQGGIGGSWVVDGEDMDIKNLNWSPKDVLGTELYKWTKLQVINAFALNIALFDQESSNRSTITVARIQAQENAIEPRLRLIEERLNHQLCPEFDERLVVEFESPVEVDEDALLEKVKTYGMSPILTYNEARKLLPELGLKPVEGGDKLIQPGKPAEQQPAPKEEANAAK